MKKLSTLTLVLTALLASVSAFSTPALNSFPSAQATIYLDFDGQYVESGAWNYGQPINAATAAKAGRSSSHASRRSAACSEAAAIYFSGTCRSSSACKSASAFAVGSCVEIIFIAALVTSVAKSL